MPENWSKRTGSNCPKCNEPMIKWVGGEHGEHGYEGGVDYYRCDSCGYEFEEKW